MGRKFEYSKEKPTNKPLSGDEDEVELILPEDMDEIFDLGWEMSEELQRRNGTGKNELDFIFEL